MGSATVVAKITSPGPNSQIAARLVDLDGAGNKILISRGTWRPDASGFQVFQLHPGAWEVEEGHACGSSFCLPMQAIAAQAALPLSNFSRPSNNQQPATIENLELRIPVREQPGCSRRSGQGPRKAGHA